MTLLTIMTAALAGALLAPQDPPPVEDPQTTPAPESFESVPVVSTPARLAAMLSPDALAVAVLEPCDADALMQFESTGLAAALTDAPWLAVLSRLGRGWWSETLAQYPIDEEQLRHALSSGAVASWNGFQNDGRMSWCVLIDLGGTARAIREALPERMATLGRSAAMRVHPSAHGEGMVWRISKPALDSRDSGFTVHCGMKGSVLCIAANDVLLDSTLTRIEKPVSPSLQDTPEWEEFMADSATAETPARLMLWCHPLRSLYALTHREDEATRAMARRLVETGDLNKVPWVGFTASMTDGKIQERLRVRHTDPSTGVFDALFGRKGDHSPSLAALVHDETALFGVARLNAQGLWRQAMRILDAVEPELGIRVDKRLDQLSTSADVEAKQHLFGNLGNTWSFVAQGAPKESGENALTPAPFGMREFTWSVDLHDAMRFTQTVDAIRSMMPFPVQGTGKSGQRTWVARSTDVESGLEQHLSVATGRLVGATSEDGLNRARGSLEAAAARPRTEQFLQSLPADATAAVLEHVARVIPDRIRAIARALNKEVPEKLTQVPEALVETLGEARRIVRRDVNGFSIESTAPAGDLLHHLAIIAGTHVATPRLQVPDLVRTMQSVQGAQEAAVLARTLKTLAAAEARTYAASGNYTDLKGLFASGEASDTGFTPVARSRAYQTQIAEGTLFEAVYTSMEDAQAPVCVVFAWPSDEGTGAVWACQAGGQPMVNDLLAETKGLLRVDKRDLFVGGYPNQTRDNFVAGWRPLDEIAPAQALAEAETEAAAPSAAESAAAASDRDLLARLAKTDPSAQIGEELVDLLRAQAEDVAVGAAQLLAKRRATEAVPALCETVATGTNIAVRRAAMASLCELRDRRSTKTSIDMLSSDDAKLRMLAATNLGTTRASEARAPLLHMLERNLDPEDSADDFVAAVMALSDIGPEDRLLDIAVAADTDQGNVGQALAFLFQTHSPKLDPTVEAACLMAVLEHEALLLRRYAVQRLGELKQPNALKALEHGLIDARNTSIKPLIEVAIAAIRGPGNSGDGSFLATARTKLLAAKDNLVRRYEAMSDSQRQILLYAGAGFIVGLLLLITTWMRRRRRLHRNAVVELVAPSSDWQDAHPEYADEAHDGYDEHAEYDDHDGYVEEGYEEEQSWEHNYDNQDCAPHAEAAPQPTSPADALPPHLRENYGS